MIHKNKKISKYFSLFYGTVTPVDTYHSSIELQSYCRGTAAAAMLVAGSYMLAACIVHPILTNVDSQQWG